MEPMVLLSLFAVSLSYGATACMLSCMPLVSPILLANGATRTQSLQVLLPLSAGRITGYVTLSLIAYAGAETLKKLIGDTALMGYILGSVTLFMALRLWIFVNRPSECCSHRTQAAQSPTALFGAGAFLSMSLCAPVLSMMALSAASPSLMWAILCGLIFGIGATLLWLFAFSVVLASMLQESLNHLARYRIFIQKTAPFILALVGIALMGGWIRL